MNYLDIEISLRNTLVKIILIALVIAYLLITFYFFTNWLKFFKRTPKLSPEDMFLSLVILVVSTILWPFVVLISSLEVLKARNLQLSSMMTVVLAMFVVSLLTISGLAAFGPALPQAFSDLFPGNHL